MDCSPSALVAAAACFQCLRGMQWAVRTSLLCQWANTPGGCPAPNVPTVGNLIYVGDNLDEVTVTSNSPGDIGGQFQLWAYNGANPPVLITGVVNPGGPWGFTGLEVLGYDWYYVIEIGNGTQWCGQAQSALIPGHPAVVGGEFVLQDELLGFWELVVNTDGLLGAVSHAGPATPIVLDDGVNHWNVIVNSSGLVGAEPTLAAATFPVPQISDGIYLWTLIVDTVGNIGTT